MRVRIGDYYLTGDPEADERVHTQAAGAVFGGGRLSGDSSGPAWTHGRRHDRANDLETLQFSTSRLFADPGEAQAWVMDYLADPPHAWAGTVTIRVEDDAGNWSEREMEDAVIEEPVCELRLGSTVLIRYTISGRPWIVGASGGPAPALQLQDGSPFQLQDGSALEL